MPVRYALFVLLALLLAAPGVTAQDATTFDITVVDKDIHPDPEAFPEVYAVDGVEGAELTLTRGETYIFQMNDVPVFHPFYISTSEIGAGAGQYNDGVTGNEATGNDQVVFVVPMDAPDLLYYECTFHPRMGWRMNIINPISDTEDELQPVAFSLRSAYPNPFDGTTRIELALERAQDVTVAVYDVAGRRVATLHDGVLPASLSHTLVFDAASGLAAGTYIVRATAGNAVVERPITLVR
ncbi:MAG: T9SS type A sorting domain-containing protein [Bacteroidota bacterium]